MRASMKFSLNAPIATITGIEEGKCHTIAFLEWTTHRVGFNTFAKRVNHTRELVSDNAVRVCRHITTPDVQV